MRRKPEPTRVERAVDAYRRVNAAMGELEAADRALNLAVVGLTPDEAAAYVLETIALEKKWSDYDEQREQIEAERAAERQAKELARRGVSAGSPIAEAVIHELSTGMSYMTLVERLENRLERLGKLNPDREYRAWCETWERPGGPLGIRVPFRKEELVPVLAGLKSSQPDIPMLVVRQETAGLVIYWFSWLKDQEGAFDNATII